MQSRNSVCTCDRYHTEAPHTADGTLCRSRLNARESTSGNRFSRDMVEESGVESTNTVTLNHTDNREKTERKINNVQPSSRSIDVTKGTGLYVKQFVISGAAVWNRELSAQARHEIRKGWVTSIHCFKHHATK